MNYLTFLLTSLLLCLAASMPASAHKFGKLSKAGKLTTNATTKAAKTPVSTAMQNALYHAAILRQIQASRLGAQSPQIGIDPFAGERISVQPKHYQPHKHRTPQQWLNELEAFVAKEGRLPYSSLGQEEHSLYAGMRSTLNRLDPQDPVAVRLRALREQYAVTKTPQQWLERLEHFIEQTGHFPTTSNKDKEQAALSTAIRNIENRLNPTDPVVVRIRELREQYPSANFFKTSQTWLSKLEEFIAKEGRFPFASGDEYVLYQAIYGLLKRLDPQDPVAVRLRELKEQYFSPNTQRGKTPQQWLSELETFIEQHGYYPSAANGKEEYVFYSRINSTLNRLSSQDPVAIRIRQLRQTYSQAIPSKTPQEWLAILETFVTKEGRFPRANLREERPLYMAAYKILKRLSPKNPIAVRIREIKAQYAHKTYQGKKPLLERVEDFVARYERFPDISIDGQEYDLCCEVLSTFERLDPQDPVVVRLRELQIQYANKQ